MHEGFHFVEVDALSVLGLLALGGVGDKTEHLFELAGAVDIGVGGIACAAQ